MSFNTFTNPQILVRFKIKTSSGLSLIALKPPLLFLEFPSWPPIWQSIRISGSSAVFCMVASFIRSNDISDGRKSFMNAISKMIFVLKLWSFVAERASDLYRRIISSSHSVFLFLWFLRETTFSWGRGPCHPKQRERLYSCLKIPSRRKSWQYSPIR